MHRKGIVGVGAVLLLVATSASSQTVRARRLQPLQPAISIVTGASTLSSLVLTSVDAQKVTLVDHDAQTWKSFPLPASAAIATPTTSTTTSASVEAVPIVILRADDEIAAVYSPDQKLSRVVTVTDASQAIVPFKGGFIVFGESPDRFAVALDSAGRETGIVQVPSWVRDMDRLGRSPITAAAKDSWALAFRYTGRIIVQRAGERAVREVPVVESRVALRDTVFTAGDDNAMAVTKRNPGSVTTVRAIAWSGDMLYALSGAAGETAGRYVDVYDGKTLEYVSSYMLPRPARSIVVNANGIVTLEPTGDGLLFFHPFK